MDDQMFIDIVQNELHTLQSNIGQKSTIDESNAELVDLSERSSTEALYQNEKDQDEEKQQDWSQITEADLELKEFECPRCLGKFKSSSDLFRHMRKVYEDPLTCQVCGKVWKDMANMLVIRTSIED